MLYYLIIRTNFFGHSIDEKKSISNLINSIKKREKIKLDDNYYFTPIYTFILIDLLVKLLRKNTKGIFNIVGNERISKYQFGLLIADILNIKNPNIVKESIDNAKLKAKRCKDLSLSNNKIKKFLKIKIPNVKNQLIQFFNNDRKIKKNFLSKIRYGQHSINKKDINFVKNILLNGPLTQGQFIRETEEKIANYVSWFLFVSDNSRYKCTRIWYVIINFAYFEIEILKKA